MRRQEPRIEINGELQLTGNYPLKDDEVTTVVVRAHVALCFEAYGDRMSKKQRALFA